MTELRTNQIAVSASAPAETIMQEQSVELDYILPDYYPDVCKLIKCFVKPSILNESVSDHRLSYELLAEVRILYCSENSHVLQCVTQNLHFSRTAELPPGETIVTEILPVTDYVNCRAVSRRRLDVRGAVTIRIRTVPIHQQNAVCDLFGKNMQLKKIPLQYQAKRMHTMNHIVLAEELELGNSKPPLLHVVRCQAKPVEQSQKLVSGNLLAQGNLQIEILYACEKENNPGLESMTFRIPYSQMIELEGVEEQDPCEVICSVGSCDLKPVTDGNGEVRVLRCEAELTVSCTAFRIATESLVCDAFSTEHPCQIKKTGLFTSSVPVMLSELLVRNMKLDCADGEMDCVYDAWCEIRNFTTDLDAEKSEICVNGMLSCFVLVRESTGMPRLLEKEEPFEHRFTVQGLGEQDRIQLRVHAENCSYTMTSASEVNIKTELRIEGSVTHCTETEVLSEIIVQEDTEHPKNYALKLYFGRAQESIWEIAKRCHTSVEAIMEENELTQEQLTENSMLLIPITN
ncbi:MAG: DUF3794 domain-containing protein [Oscillospiraceae bacterium]|nr:DUF3794 domain-containing protein [Oscillospiraceae bacterium]